MNEFVKHFHYFPVVIFSDVQKCKDKEVLLTFFLFLMKIKIIKILGSLTQNDRKEVLVYVVSKRGIPYISPPN